MVGVSISILPIRILQPPIIYVLLVNQEGPYDS